ncbi:MAG: hypothetical protein V7K32_04525 [Nostoc sp.]|uniref:hypothetical protein n=1 Tax=Nostoc sp. TaxID=1180 RepID=UPI002FF89331
MKKLLFLGILAIGMTIPTTSLLAQNSVDNPDNSDPPGLRRPPEFNHPIIPEPPLPTTPTEYLYPDNSAKSVLQMITKERAIGQLRQGLNLKNARLITYADYIKFKTKLGGDIVENAQVHPNRRVWLIEIDAPNGIDVAQRVRDEKTPHPEKFKKSKILMVVDAETGDGLSVDIAENQ